MSVSHLKKGEIAVYKTENGTLLPADEESEKRVLKMKPYEWYKITLKAFRNYGHHKKYFALLKLAFDNQDHFRDEKFFRDHIMLKIGHVETFLTKGGELLYVVKSISFATCTQHEFDDIYKKTVTFLMEYYGFDESFSKELHNFR